MPDKKIIVVYPDGREDCQEIVTDTYVAALEFIGLERVRALDKRYNSINIVSTREEMLKSKGKKKESLQYQIDHSSNLGICKQFDTPTKHRILNDVNQSLNAGLQISLLEGNSIKILKTEDNYEIREGLLNQYNATRYERSHIARRLCLAHYGNHIVCQVCGFNFEKTYGKREDSDPYIEIHHINPLAATSAKKGEHNVDCSKDLIPVCANCHRMLHHYKKGKTLHPTELKKILEDKK